MGRNKKASLLAYRADAGDPLPSGVLPGLSTRVDVGRFDAKGVTRTPQGGLKVPAYLTREGVFNYTLPDGTVRREYRPADEVFKADSLASLEDAPVTDLHNGLVSAENHGQLAKGHVRDIRQDGSHVAATVLVQDAAIVAAVQSGARKELSCGYVCKLENTAGVTPQGERYDAIQRDIQYNHVAILPPGAGRAGSTVSLRLDAATAVCLHEAPTTKEPLIVKTIRIDGKDYVVGSDEHLAKIQADHDAALAVVRKDAADARAAQAKAEAERDVARTDAADARDPVKQAARVAARVALEESARKVLGAEAKFDGKTDDEIKAAVVAKTFPEFKLDSYDAAVRPVYLAARFDAAIAAPIADPITDVAGARATLIAPIAPTGAQEVDYTWKPVPLSMTSK